MAGRDLSAFLEDDGLTVTLGGVTYSVASPSAATGLHLQRLVNIGIKVSSGGTVSEADVDSAKLDDDDERDLMHMVLGTARPDGGNALAEMIDNDLKWDAIQRTTRYALIWFTVGPEAADKALESGVLMGEAQAPNRAQRRAAKKASPRTATSTRSRGSTASTRSRSGSRKAT